MNDVQLPSALTTKVIAQLPLSALLMLYRLELTDFLTEHRARASEPDDEKNYRYGNLFCDLHGQPEEYERKVLEYGARIISEGWEPVWWYAPIVRLVNNGGMMDLVEVITVRIRARRLRSDVVLKRELCQT